MNPQLGFDPSIGRENELFGVNIKNVHNLEKDLVPISLGQNISHFFLEQINNMTSYPVIVLQATPKLRELVEVVIGYQDFKQEKHGGMIDAGWKRKQRNVLEGITTSVHLTTVLS